MSSPATRKPSGSDKDGEGEWLLDPLDDDHAHLYGNAVQLSHKVVTRTPLATSAPSYFETPRSSVYLNGEQAQLIPQHSNHSDQDFVGYAVQSPTADRRPRSRRSRSIISFDMKSINERVSQWTSTIAKWTSTSGVDGVPNEIQYSVFRPPPGIIPLKQVPPQGFIYTGPVNRYHFDAIVEEAINAVESGVQPKRIAAGSSGSYFLYNTRGDIVGVFKPKDEEPYGPLSPKWTKWLHRNLFPCFFGRSCLIPNLGYVCESAASLLDKQLQTHIVPYTDIVEISSESFYYSYWEKRSARKNNRPLREKAGSFQLFLRGYQEADKFFGQHPLPGSRWGFSPFPDTEIIPDSDPFSDSYAEASGFSLGADSEFRWTKETLKQFREELEKLVILDYIMRNTDRGLDNWMIRVEWRTTEHGNRVPTVKIGAIDSGLSWPWKHPDEWRSYPFGWLFLPVSIIGQPFSETTRDHFLPILTSIAWWEESSVLFRALFSRDEDFKERMWKKQWAVMKGQAFNVVETLKNPTQGPLELARRTRVMVWDEVMEVPLHVPVTMMASAIETPISTRTTSKPVSGTPLDRITEEDGDEDQTASDNLSSNDLGGEGEFSLNLNSGSAGEGVEDDGLTFAQDTMATKLVIVERLQAVNSKPPVFTWC